MKPDRPRPVITTNVSAHPAVIAWLAMTGSGRIPGSVTVIRDRPSPLNGIFRLSDVGEGGAAVVAKRAPADQILLERLINERFLPGMRLTAPHYYGTSLTGSVGWLFLEDVGDTRYSLSDPEHLSVAARWIGTLHVAAARLGSVVGLPDAGPSRYLRQLRAARVKVHTSLGRWTFAPAEIETLARVLSWLEAIEGRWPRIETGCAGAPPTLVHGDFRPKNAYLRSNGDGLHLFTIDWEMAGWGPPAIDLTRIDAAAYWREVRDAWPGVDLVTVERLARFGRVLGAVAAVDWESEDLGLEKEAHRSQAVSNLSLILERLIASVRTAGVAE